MAHSHTARPITDANNVRIIPSERTYIRLWRIDGAISPIYTRTTGSDFTPSRPACVAGDSIDYSVFCGEWCIGRIYEKRSAPQHQLVLVVVLPQQTRQLSQLELSGDAGRGQG